MNVPYRQSICVVVTATFAWFSQLGFAQETSQVPQEDRGTESSIAHQVTGELGSPSTTTTIGGKQLRPPQSKVRRSDQGDNHNQGLMAPRRTSQRAHPNVLFIITDDAVTACQAPSAA